MQWSGEYCTTKCIYWKLINWLPVVTYLHGNQWNVQCHGRTRSNFGVDFLLLFCHIYLKSFSPNIFKLQTVSHMNMLPYETSGISNQALIVIRCENVRVTDGHCANKCHFLQHPCRKIVWSKNFCTMKLSEEPNFYHLVKTRHIPFSSVSRTGKMLTLNWSESFILSAW